MPLGPMGWAWADPEGDKGSGPPSGSAHGWDVVLLAYEDAFDLRVTQSSFFFQRDIFDHTLHWLLGHRCCTLEIEKPYTTEKRIAFVATFPAHI